MSGIIDPVPGVGKRNLKQVIPRPGDAANLRPRHHPIGRRRILGRDIDSCRDFHTEADRGSREFISAHLQCWVDLEQRGVVFVGGPLLPEDLSREYEGVGSVSCVPRHSVMQEIRARDTMHESNAAVAMRAFQPVPVQPNAFSKPPIRRLEDLPQSEH
jgi:hypothetical protein